MNKSYKLYACCIPQKGAERSIIYDLQRSDYCLIPSSLFNFLKEIDLFEVNNITELNNPIINEYIEFLSKNEYLFITSEPECFPSLKLVWDSSSSICNSIIDINNDFKYLKSTIDQLDKLYCNALHLRIFKPILLEELNRLLKIIDDSNIASIDIFIEYSKLNNIKTYRNFINKNIKVKSILLFNSPYNKLFYKIPSKKHIPIVFSKDSISSEMCGIIHPNYFTINMKLFTESQLHNTCLNRKICIDADGEIKNCPSMKQSYGNIKDTTLKEAMEKPGFKDLWFICKDKIDVCKDCEFRHMCTDCRAFIKDPDNIYSQPAKCPYNPYIAKWQGEEGYVPVEECGTYTKEKGFVVNKRKVSKLNKEIWGEE